MDFSNSRGRLVLTWRAAKPFIVWAVAAVCIVSAVLATRPSNGGEIVFVAARDLSAGENLKASDLVAVLVPSEAVPEASLTEESLKKVGPEATLGSPVSRGRVVVATDFDRDRPPPGTARLSLTVDPGLSPAAALANLVQTVDIWGPPDACLDRDARPEVLAKGATVQWEQEQPGGSTFAASSERGSLVTIVVPVGAVAPILCSAKTGSVHFVESG